MQFEDGLKGLYYLIGATLVLPYLVQARVAWKSQHRAADVSLPTWYFWCGTSTVSLLYAILIANDGGVILAAVGNLTGCLAVAGTATWRRVGPPPRVK